VRTTGQTQDAETENHGACDLIRRSCACTGAAAVAAGSRLAARSRA